jgi:hypothetical protein
MSTTNLGRYLLIVASVGVTVVLFNYFSSTIALFTAAGIVAALLNVPLAWLEQRLPRPLAITLVALGAHISPPDAEVHVRGVNGCWRSPAAAGCGRWRRRIETRWCSSSRSSAGYPWPGIAPAGRRCSLRD